MRTKLLAAFLLPLLLVTAAACTTSADGKDVASVDGSAAPSTTSSLSRLDQLTRYSECMRAHGVPMTDPQVDGDTVSAGKIDGEVDKNNVDDAEEACKQHRPAQEGAPEVALKEQLSREFARCMREHRVENYPDPDPDGRTRVSEAVGKDPQYPDAKTTCDAQSAASFASRTSP